MINNDNISFRHDSSVQCVSYHPTSHLLASCSNADFGLWSPEQKNVTKTKLTGRITCCAWSADGQLLAFGLYNGQVHIRDKVNLNGEIKIKRILLNFRMVMKNIDSIDLMQLIHLYGMYHGVLLGKNSNDSISLRIRNHIRFRDDELLLAAVDWGQKLTLYQANGTKQV